MAQPSSMSPPASPTSVSKKQKAPKSPVMKKSAPISPPSSPDSKKKDGPPVHNINDLEKDNADIKISPDTLGLGWKVNTSPSTIDTMADLKKPLTTPLIKKIDLLFPTGIEVTARNMKGVTIRDALDAIHKQLKKKPDDEMDEPYLKGFEWDREEAYTKFKVHFQKDAGPKPPSSKKHKKKDSIAE